MWEKVLVEPPSGRMESLEPATSGLQADPVQVHAAMWEGATHLSEARRLHAEVLAHAAGPSAEHRAADTRPLVGMLAELHGRPTAEGFILPLRGCEPEDVHLAIDGDAGERRLRLEAVSREDHRLSRTTELPERVASVEAQWSEGELIVRFL